MILTFKGDEVTITGETGNGEPIKANFIAKANGKEYATTNTPYDHIIVKQVDPDHQIVTFKKDGRIQSTSHVEIKGNTMTDHEEGTGPDGKKFEASSVFYKQ